MYINNNCMKIFYSVIVWHASKIRKCFNLHNLSFKPRHMLTSKYRDKNSSDKLSSTEFATFRQHSRNSYYQILCWRFMYKFKTHHIIKKIFMHYQTIINWQFWKNMDDIKDKLKKMKCTTHVSWIIIVGRGI